MTSTRKKLQLTVTREVVPFDATHCNMTQCRLFTVEHDQHAHYLCAGEELEKDKRDGTALRSQYCIQNAKDTEEKAMPTVELRGKDGLMAALTDKDGPERWRCKHVRGDHWCSFSEWSVHSFDDLTSMNYLWRRRSALESIEVPEGVTVSAPDEQGDVRVFAENITDFVLRRAPVSLYETMAVVARALREDSEAGNA